MKDHQLSKVLTSSFVLKEIMENYLVFKRLENELKQTYTIDVGFKFQTTVK